MLRAVIVTLIAVFANSPLWSASRMQDVFLKLSGRAHVEFQFETTEGKATEFPSFFIKTDSARNAVLLSFLETETLLPLGILALPASAALVNSVEIKRLRSPSGRVFLGIEFVMKTMPKIDWEPKQQGNSALRVALGSVSKKGVEWSYSKTLSTPATVPEPASEPEHIANPIPDSSPAPAPTATPKPKPTPVSIETPKAKPITVITPTSVTPRKMSSIKVNRSGGKTEVTLTLNGKEIPQYQMEKSIESTPAVALTLHGAFADSAAAKFDIGRGGIRSVRLKQHDSDLIVVLILDSSMLPTISTKPGKVILAFTSNSTSSFNWNSTKPTPPQKPIREPELSAHAEGISLEKKKTKRVTSSAVFTVGGKGKTMLVLRDSLVLGTRVLMAGDRVKRLGTKSGSVQVHFGSDTGYLSKSNLVYVDELKPQQEKSIASQIKARTEAKVIVNKTEPIPQKDSIKTVAASTPKAVAPPAIVVTPAMDSVATKAKPIVPKSKTVEPKLSMPVPGDAPKLAVPAKTLATEKKSIDSEKIDLTPEKERVTYNSFGRRDPFIPMEQGSMDNGIDIDQMKVVGIVWESDPMAVLEHVRDANLSFTVKQGDPVHNGRVTRITHDYVTFELTEFGISRSYTLKLVPTQERAGK